ncbi:MAG: IS66 family transposase [Lachnospiraceae bacterium]|nr:IS66 family transposase [Lachnospiraceae bacterium]
MKDFSQLSVEELNRMDKQVLVTIIVSLQKQLNAISSQLGFLSSQIALMNQRSFGRKTEKLDQIAGQMDFFEVFNEPEFLSDTSSEPEVSEVTISGYTRKKKTSREQNLEGLPARIFEHKLSDAELKELFPNGYKELPAETYKRLSIIPQTFLVDEHHVHVYASKNNDGTIIKAKRPKDLFRNSIATPSLVAAIIHAKYTNHLPLERQSRCYQDNGVKLETNTMANWMMNSADLYLNTVYEELHKQLLGCPIIHADETPLRVIRDGRPAGSESRMWVYKSGGSDDTHPIVLYDFHLTRKTSCPDEFLKGYSGTLVTDGYQVYHSLEKKRDGLKVAGCWVHAKRKFAEMVKAGSSDTIAAEAVSRISGIFHLDKQLEQLNSEERLRQRVATVKPRVDDFFAWAKKTAGSGVLPKDSATQKALQYCINQEQFLRVFLSDGDVPMHNNPAEQAIRPFTLGRKNWVNMDTIRGAQTSAILYSLVETARANHLRIYDYLELLLAELVQHSDDTCRDFVYDLMPWSDHVREKCCGKKNS